MNDDHDEAAHETATTEGMPEATPIPLAPTEKAPEDQTAATDAPINPADADLHVIHDEARGIVMNANDFAFTTGEAIHDFVDHLLALGRTAFGNHSGLYREKAIPPPAPPPTLIDPESQRG